MHAEIMNALHKCMTGKYMQEFMNTLDKCMTAAGVPCPTVLLPNTPTPAGTLSSYKERHES